MRNSGIDGILVFLYRYVSYSTRFNFFFEYKLNIYIKQFREVEAMSHDTYKTREYFFVAFRRGLRAV